MLQLQRPLLARESAYPKPSVRMRELVCVPVCRFRTVCNGNRIGQSFTFLRIICVLTRLRRYIVHYRETAVFFSIQCAYRPAHKLPHIHTAGGHCWEEYSVNSRISLIYPGYRRTGRWARQHNDCICALPNPSSCISHPLLYMAAK